MTGTQTSQRTPPYVYGGLALNKPGAQIQVRCPHTVKGHATTDSAVKCGQAMARRLPGAPKGGGRA